MRSRLWITAIIGFSIVAAASCTQQETAPPAPERSPIAVGDAAPTFALRSASGGMVSLSDYAGKPYFPASLTWNLEVSGMPRIVKAAIDAAEFVAFESRNVPWPLDEGLDLQARQLFVEIRNELKARDAGL